MAIDKHTDDASNTPYSPKESALQRWSRRKLDDDHEATAVVDEPETLLSAELSPSDTEADTGSDAPIAEGPVPLPDVDTLDVDSDYSGFMSAEVDVDLRRAALRKLFALPTFASRDGLDDYDHDYTQFEGLGDIVTHEMKRLALREAQRLAEAEAACGDDLPGNSIDTIADADDSDDATAGTATTGAATADAPTVDDHPETERA